MTVEGPIAVALVGLTLILAAVVADWWYWRSPATTDDE